MPMKPKPLPDFVEWCPARKKVKCTICAPYEPLESRHWIAKENMRTHVVSQTHARSVELRQLAEQHNAAMQARMAQDAAAVAQFAELQAGHSIAACRDKPTQRKSLNAMEEAMWMNYAENGADFDLGSDDDIAAEKARLRFEKTAENFAFSDARAAARDLGFSEEAAPEHNEEEEEDILTEILNNAVPIEAMSEVASDLRGKDTPWYPYESKTMFLLDTLDNLPRLRVSSSLMKVFLWILQETGAREVPSFDRLRKTQASLRLSGAVPTIPCCSPRGNVFHMNDPRAIIAKDWANPLVRPLLRVYPEIPPNGVVSEVWHAEKWRKDLDLDALSPMYDANGKHFYVNELACLQDGRWVIPIRWVTFQGKTHADAFLVTQNEQRACFLVPEPILICAEDLKYNYFDLEARQELPLSWNIPSGQVDYSTRMPNPLRDLAQGDHLYTSLVDYFGDDVSGNRSKSWNKHWNAYMTHRNLPRQLLQQEFHVHFVSTSQHASIPEQFLDFKRAVESTHTSPVAVRDALTGQISRFRVYVNAEPSDNPMASEVSGHIGGQGNQYCRKCDVGGTDKEKESEEGYHRLFMVGTPRNKEQTLQQVRLQVRLACRGIAQPVKDSQKASGVKDMYTEVVIEDLLTRARCLKQRDRARPLDDIQDELLTWVSDNHDSVYNPFLTLQGFDPNTDTPVEILHTVLLGIVKYAWHNTHTCWTTNQKSIYARRLQAANITGLSIPPIRANYIMQFANSLIGRQFKIIAQLSVFCLYDLVPPPYLRLWRAIGVLSALVWFPEIPNMAQYLDDVDIAVSNVLDAFADIDPSKMCTKIKLHLSRHIQEDILRFGPLVGVCTEAFESFNAVFRSCSILSNHQAPSRDIARQLADQEGLKHRLTSGWWLGDDDEWVCAGPAVRDFIKTRPILQSLVGWTSHALPRAGDVKLLPIPAGTRTRPSLTLNESLASNAVNLGMHDINLRWYRCKHAISGSLDECIVGSWVVAKDDQNSPFVGQVLEILTGIDNSQNRLVVIDVFEIAAEADAMTQLPVLVRRHEEHLVRITNTASLQFDFNVQHHCALAKCTDSGRRPCMQERKETTRLESFIEHQPPDRYLINLHGFHNAHLIRTILPRQFTAPIALHADRTAQHALLSLQLRDVQGRKRAAQKAKRDLKKANVLRLDGDIRPEGQDDDRAGTVVPEHDPEDIQHEERAGKRKRLGG